MKINVAGEEVKVTPGGNYQVFIREIYYSAGKKYGWKPDSGGIGLSMDLIEQAAREQVCIFITVSGMNGRWYITGQKALELVYRYDAFHTARGGIRLGVISFREFMRID